VSEKYGAKLNLISQFPLVSFLYLFWKRTFTDKWHRLLLARCPFLSANQQCPGTEGNKALTLLRENGISGIIEQHPGVG